VPFEIHLMVTDPREWIESFAEAGADGFVFCLDSMQNPQAVLKATRAAGKSPGISLLIPEPLELVEPYLEQIDVLTIVGTAMGIKGASMDPSVPDKIRRARGLISQRGLKVEIEVDGGIRRESVPVIDAAGADWIVPGSLMFKEDPAEMRKWLKSLSM